MAREIPVLPDVGSRMTLPGRRGPSASAASIIRSAIRSFSEPVGFCPSSLAHNITPGRGERRWMPTTGVSPMASRMSPARIARDYASAGRHDLDRSIQPADEKGMRSAATRSRVSISEGMGYPADMLRRLVLASLPVCVLLIASACTQPRVIVDSPPPAPASGAQASDGQDPAQPSPDQIAQWGGLAVIAQPYIQYLFAPPEIVSGTAKAPPTDVRRSTLQLMDSVTPHKRLELTPLPSTDGTVALGFQETTPYRQRWGAIMIPAQRHLFALFAADRSLGNWLIIVDDVIVTGGPDPVPLTAYRWPRSAVEQYASCGIPLSLEIEDCTHGFYGAARTVFVIRSGTNIGQ